MSRKAKANLKNLGGALEASVTPYFSGPDLAQSRTSVSLLERVLMALLRSEIARLQEDEAELTRFFSHFFDPTAGPEERERFVKHFLREPPVVVLGYPRTSGEFPCFAVVLESDEETEPELMADYMGQTQEGEDGPAAEYVGGFMRSSYGSYVYAQNPDVTIYLYQFAKMVIFGAKQALECAGFIDTRISGGELNPEELYMPDNMYARVLRIQSTAAVTVPRLITDPAKIRLLGLYMDDIVVDGIRGGVTPYAVGDEEDDEE